MQHENSLCETAGGSSLPAVSFFCGSADQRGIASGLAVKCRSDAAA